MPNALKIQEADEKMPEMAKPTSPIPISPKKTATIEQPQIMPINGSPNPSESGSSSGGSADSSPEKKYPAELSPSPIVLAQSVPEEKEFAKKVKKNKGNARRGHDPRFQFGEVTPPRAAATARSHETVVPRVSEHVRNQRELDIREEPRVTPRAQFEVENNAGAENGKHWYNLWGFFGSGSQNAQPKPAVSLSPV